MSEADKVRDMIRRNNEGIATCRERIANCSGSRRLAWWNEILDGKLELGEILEGWLESEL